MVRYCAAFLTAAVLGFVATAEDDKKDPPIKGAWVKSEGESVSLDFKAKDKLIVTVTVGDSKVVATCTCEVDKDGLVKATIKEVGGDAPEKPPVGYEFKFKFKVDKEKKTAKLSDFEGENADGARAIMEGEYKPKKGD
jgi:major membrane immunogen (membrane-anchored lipoprotein)